MSGVLIRHGRSVIIHIVSNGGNFLLELTQTACQTNGIVPWIQTCRFSHAVLPRKRRMQMMLLCKAMTRRKRKRCKGSRQRLMLNMWGLWLVSIQGKADVWCNWWSWHGRIRWAVVVLMCVDWLLSIHWCQMIKQENAARISRFLFSSQHSGQRIFHILWCLFWRLQEAGAAESQIRTQQDDIRRRVDARRTEQLSVARVQVCNYFRFICSLLSPICSVATTTNKLLVYKFSYQKRAYRKFQDPTIIWTLLMASSKYFFFIFSMYE